MPDADGTHVRVFESCGLEGSCVADAVYFCSFSLQYQHARAGCRPSRVLCELRACEVLALFPRAGCGCRRLWWSELSPLMVPLMHCIPRVPASVKQFQVERR